MRKPLGRNHIPSEGLALGESPSHSSYYRSRLQKSHHGKTPEDWAALTDPIISARSEGLGLNQIAARVGCSRSYVYTTLRKAGADTDPSRTATRALIARIRNLLADGKSRSEIAAELSLPLDDLRAFARTNQIRFLPKPLPRYHEARNETIRHLYNLGFTQAVIAAVIRTDQPYVSLLIGRLGLRPPKGV